MKRIIMLLIIAVCFAACKDKMVEKVESRFENGQPKYIKSFTKQGECVKETEYYETGQVKMEGALQDGHREGEWKAYFPNGKPQSTGFFENGLRTGKANVFYEDGTLHMEGFYKEGKHCGLWKYYDESGKLLREDDYGE